MGNSRTGIPFINVFSLLSSVLKLLQGHKGELGVLALITSPSPHTDLDFVDEMTLEASEVVQGGLEGEVQARLVAREPTVKTGWNFRTTS